MESRHLKMVTNEGGGKEDTDKFVGNEQSKAIGFAFDSRNKKINVGCSMVSKLFQNQNHQAPP